MQGLPFNSTEFLGQYASEIKAIEKGVYMKHQAKIIDFLTSVRDNVQESSDLREFSRSYTSEESNAIYGNIPTIRKIEQMAREILEGMEADLKQAVTKKYILTQRPDSDTKDDKPCDKKKSVCDRLRNLLP